MYKLLTDKETHAKIRVKISPSKLMIENPIVLNFYEDLDTPSTSFDMIGSIMESIENIMNLHSVEMNSVRININFGFDFIDHPVISELNTLLINATECIISTYLTDDDIKDFISDALHYFYSLSYELTEDDENKFNQFFNEFFKDDKKHDNFRVAKKLLIARFITEWTMFKNKNNLISYISDFISKKYTVKKYGANVYSATYMRYIFNSLYERYLFNIKTV